MLNPNLSLAHGQDELRSRRRVQLRDFLLPEVAARLTDCLQTEVPWTLAMMRDGHSKTLSAEEYARIDEAGRARLLRELAEQSRGGFGFAYESYMMIRAYKEGRDPDLMLHRLTEFLNAEPFLRFARALTGLDRIRRVSAQATRYRAGHFLRMHTDDVRPEGRLAAYVINLTPVWNADLGGMLHFLGADGGISDVYYPWFNSLSLFLVPEWHFVSPVAPYADKDRLAITGWFEAAA